MLSKFTKKQISSKQITHNLHNLSPTHAGIDIGADSIYVCALDENKLPEVREYPVFTRDLKSMTDWLKSRGVKNVAMESTGVYWIPTFEILEEEGFEVCLVNAYHMKCVPGRKTDVKDAQWIQQLHSSGLLGASFRPKDECVRLRSIVRQRSELFRHAAGQIQHMHKALTEMNIQLRIVISDITGQTGLAIINAILQGERNPHKLASLRNHRCKNSVEEIAKALEGNWRDEQILILKQSYETYEFFHKQIKECEKVIEGILKQLPAADLAKIPPGYKPPSDPHEPFRSKKVDIPARRKPAKKTDFNRSPYSFDLGPDLLRICGVDLTEIPGIAGNIAMTILSEIGTDMSKWPSKKHFASWLALCPGNKKSGGKILSSKTRPSTNRAAQALRMAAVTLRNSDTSLGAYFRRMRSKLGPAKAVTATAHKMAIIIYTMMKFKIGFKELGSKYYEQQYRDRLTRALIKKAELLGFELKAKPSV
jgi:transposase